MLILLIIRGGPMQSLKSLYVPLVFSETEIMPMGGTLYVIHDLIYSTLYTCSKNHRFFSRMISKLALESLNFVYPLICRIGENAPISSKRITTGWFVVC